MTAVQQVSIQCECHHLRGLLYVVRPWVWGRPCRRCRRMMDRNLVVVPTSGAAAIVMNSDLSRRRRTPIVVTTTMPQAVATPVPAQTALDWQSSQEACPSVLPPKYSQQVAAN